ncbi:uncharacterized protein [Rutidosis leptorrhynchoides]|uniref:uncharacterized protein n=1 Tax=Rutidosis leptorrhynchoides TaxID=125765 RepID=UPI003A997A15
MSSLPEVTVLFARLASQIQNEAINSDQSDDVLVTVLNQSLNLNEVPRVRVLDSALSIMCFTAPQVFDSVIDYSVNTLVSVLSSLIDCKVTRMDKKEIFRIGSSLSCRDCEGVMEACADVLGKLSEQGMYYRPILYSVVRLAAMTTQFRYIMRVTPVVDVQSTEGSHHAMTKLMHYIPKSISLEKQELELRLLSWSLDPQNLVKDVLQVLQDAIGRPFMCLSLELYEKLEWRSIIICLALSPLMFIETRALLHQWFLLTGLASTLELQVELVSMVLDLLSSPMKWGLSLEVGSKLPFSYAYFLYKHQLFRAFAGPLSLDGFLNLVHKIKKSISQTKKKLKHSATTSMVDHKAAWAMAMNFPSWFYFAALLLNGKNSSDNFFCRLHEDNQLQKSLCSVAAAWYIAWVLDPVDESASGLLAKKLEKLSTTLINKHTSAYEYRERTSSDEIKLKKPKPNDKTNDAFHKFQPFRLWLEEFETVDIKNNVMFRRITLGILIGCSGSINDDECESILHYVSTGTILHTKESRCAGLKHKRRNFEFIDGSSLKEAVAGACTVFYLTDIAERMSDTIFETREVAVDFICSIKLRTVKYLLKCVKRLLEFEFHQNNDILIKDLKRRMLQWRYQGNDIFHGYKDFDDAINEIASKLS